MHGSFFNYLVADVKNGYSSLQKEWIHLWYGVGEKLKYLLRFCQFPYWFFQVLFFSFAALSPISFCLKRNLVKSNSVARCAGALTSGRLVSGVALVFWVEPCRGVGSFGGASFVAGMLVESETLGFWVRTDGCFGNLEEPEGSVFFFFPASTSFLKKTVRVAVDDSHTAPETAILWRPAWGSSSLLHHTWSVCHIDMTCCFCPDSNKWW